MLSGVIITVYFENHVISINTLCVKNRGSSVLKEVALAADVLRR
jgi:hypothetical protein